MTQDQATVKADHANAVAADEADAAGLTEAEAARRLAQYGENALVEHHVSVLERLAHFFWGPIPWMIEIAAVLSAALGHWDDLAIILAMLFINAGVGFWQEFKADNAIALLEAAARRSRRASSATANGRTSRRSCWSPATSSMSSSATSFPPI